MPPRKPRAKSKAASSAANGEVLVIVESKAKATTLQRFLGDDYNVLASIGHVRDLPKDSIGVRVDNDFEPLYVVPREKRKIVEGIGQAAARASKVLIATDPDREGESIAWHLLDAANLDRSRVGRVTFHEITKDAIESAVENPGDIDMRLVESQQARRILDRLVGFEISPLLARRIRGARSAGRVQSVALRFLVEREREIRAFVPREWWTVEGRFAPARGDEKTFGAELELVDGKLEIDDETEADRIVASLRNASFGVADIRERFSSHRPAAPFTTATMQRAASSSLSMSPSATMRAAQQLYEGMDAGAEEGQVGLITYMRTDSTQVARSAQDQAREFVAKEFGDDFVPARPPVYKTKSRSAQEAHEAIRPTSVFRTPDSLAPHLDKRQLRLYELIWRRFVASQMKAAQVRTVTVLLSAASDGEQSPYRFRATTSETVFQGHFAVSRAGERTREDEEIARAVLLSLNQDDKVFAGEIAGVQHFTEPPPRYTEASLIRELEEAGIGRPSTYAPTIDTLRNRQYAEIEKRALVPTELGESVTDAMIEHFPEIVDSAFTSRMESELDQVAAGDLGRVDLLGEFWKRFAPTLADAKQNMKTVRAPVEPLGEECPECGKELVVRRGRSGKFVGCSGFPECRYTRAIGIGVDCPKCGEGLVVERQTKRRRTFYGCSRYPDCDYASWKRPTTEKCPTCENVLYAAGRGRLVCDDCGFRKAAA